mgnify:CR=1 FL=1
MARQMYDVSVLNHGNTQEYEQVGQKIQILNASNPSDRFRIY